MVPNVQQSDHRCVTAQTRLHDPRKLIALCQNKKCTMKTDAHVQQDVIA